MIMVHVAVVLQPVTSCPTSHACCCMSLAFTTAGDRILRVHKTSRYIFNQTCSYTYTMQSIHAGTQHIPIHGLPSVNHIHT